MSLVARALETAGIATVIIGSAIDIVEHWAVPRFVFTDFPLGNHCGKPFESKSQDHNFELAMELLRTAMAPQSIIHSKLLWSKDLSWKSDFMYVGPENLSLVRELGERRRALQKQAKS